MDKETDRVSQQEQLTLTIERQCDRTRKQENNHVAEKNPIEWQLSDFLEIDCSNKDQP